MLDAAAASSAPGLVDLHTHLRQPGREEAETVETGARAAALGGLHRGRRHAQHRAAPSTRAGGRARGARPRARRRCATCARRPAPSPWAGRGEQLAPHGRDGRRSACGSSPTTAPACRTPGSCAGRSSTPRALGVTLAQHCEDDGAGRRRPHARGRVVEPARHPRHPGRGRGADGGARHRPRPPHRRPGPLPAPVDGRVGRPGAGRPRPAGCRSRPRPRPTTSRSPTPSCASLRPGVQGQPAAAHRRRRRRRPGRAGRRHHRRHRHRPRAPHPGGEGAAVRRGAAGHARAGDGAGAGAHRARPAASSRCWRCCRGSRPRIAGLDGRARRAGRRGPPGQPVRDRPGRHVGRSSPTRAGQPQPQHALRRPQARPAGCATPLLRRRARSSIDGRRGASTMCTARSREATRCWCWPTAPCSRARPSAPSRRRGRDRRGRVQHRAVRLPGGHHRPVLRRARSSRSPTRTSATTASRRRRREPAAVLPGRRRARPGPPPQQLAGRAATSTPSCGATACPASPASTPAASPATSATAGAMPGAFGTADEATLQAGRRGRARHRRRRPRRHRHDDRALHGRRPGRCRVVAYDYGIKTHDPAPPRRRSPPSRSCRRRRPAAECSPASPTACSSPTAPATPPRRLRASTPSASLLGEVPVFGICLGHQLLGTRPRRRDLQAPVRPPRRQPPGARAAPPARSRSPARTTTTPSPRARVPPAPTSPT